MNKLVSLSPAVSSVFSSVANKDLPEWFCTHDPVGKRLGSGGGTAHLIREAWKSEDSSISFAHWLSEEKRIILHAGGQSRRLPAYAAEGKSLLPVPVFRWSRGQKINQTLLDLQVPFLEEMMERSAASSKWCIASGDVYITADKLPSELPDVDVLCVGLWDDAEVARKHGVFFTPKQKPEELAFMLQKPEMAEIKQLSQNYFFLLDVGIWILSERAMNIVLERSGIDPSKEHNTASSSDLLEYDLYGSFGPSLGTNPHDPDTEISKLSVAILALDEGKFYHFGSNRDLVKSTLKLQNKVIDQRRLGSLNIKPHPSLFVQNAVSEIPLTSRQSSVWLENAYVAKGWKLKSDHIITGVPQNNWSLEFSSGDCLDCVATQNGDWVIRTYGMDDTFRGAVSEKSTLWMNEPIQDWLEKRNLSLSDLQITPDTDIQSAAIFPVVESLSEDMIQWMLMKDPEGNQELRELYLCSTRISADAIGSQADLLKRDQQRQEFRDIALVKMAQNGEQSVFYQLDLEHMSSIYAKNELALNYDEPDKGVNIFKYVHDRMFRSRVLTLRGQNGKDLEKEAFDTLRESIISTARSELANPVYDCKEDQIVWGRSPVRLDLAGGWTDTPPYCFINGGRVVNVAVELNGQPPIQTFIRMRRDPVIKLRSIDLGVSQEIRTYEEISEYATIGSGFAIPKAALALCGFHPRFTAHQKFLTLKQQLESMGGGMEISLLCAVPKGSGLGTSSILSATILGALNSVCQLGWDSNQIGQRVLVLEQMLTSGGGWQDQFGGIFRGIKYLNTKPGLEQVPKIRWLPDFMMTSLENRQCLLLYYTGITRVAKSVLGEIVQGMFLNSESRLSVLGKIGQNADFIREALEVGNWERFGSAIEKSWLLNKALDSGTSTPEIDKLLSKVDHWLLGKKLLGAGGGGYLLMVAHDPESAASIRKTLLSDPPNRAARFVDVNVSETGLQITRS